MSTVAIQPTADRAAWNAYVAAHPRATQYHGYEWLDVFAASFGHRTFPLAALRDGAVVGVLPLVLVHTRLFGRRLVSLPFVNYGGILADAADVEQQLWEAAVEVAKRERSAYLEARHFTAHPFVTDRKQHKATMILELAATVEEQWKGFDAKLRNQIRKAQRSGLTFRAAGSEGLTEFYEVFARCMRELGTPVYDRRYFAEILRRFPEASGLLLVESEKTVIAGGLTLRHRDTLELPWAASLVEHRSKCPNNMLYWELIQQAIRSGLRRFDFGRSTPGDGPYRFKEQWGALPVPLQWEYWLPGGAAAPDLSPKNARFSAAIDLWRRLPLAVTNWLGPLIVRGIP